MRMGTIGGDYSQLFLGKTFEGIDHAFNATSFSSLMQKVTSHDPVSRYTQYTEIPTTKNQDHTMLNYVADRSAQDANNPIHYSPFTNNCADFVRDTLNSAGIQTERQMIPNDFFKGVNSKADLPQYSGTIGYIDR